MANLNEEIIQVIHKTPGLTDRELTNALRGSRASQQPINQAARKLEQKGCLIRKRRQDNLIGNYPSGTYVDPSTQTIPSDIINHDVDALSEDGIKKVLDSWLRADGWETKIAWGNKQGIDIDARRGSERWIIEAKGPGSRQPMRVNYFIGILGETLQRMSEPKARYSIAFPDIEQYRRLWERLPKLAKSRTRISMILVSKEGGVALLSE
jgi:hypothetical protein